jgi:rhodanese-related sulfurtransferase
VDIPVIDVNELAVKIADGAPVIDVRQRDEYEEARAPGVRLIPLGEIPDRLAEVPTEGSVYVICKSGVRSAKAVEFLRAHGVDAFNVAGGTMGWIDAGHRVESGA